MTVSGTGFKPKDQVYITECQANAKGEAGCDIFLATPVKITRHGRVAQDEVQGRDRHHRQRQVRHRWRRISKKCAVSVGNASGGDSAVFKIVFAAPKK